MQLIPINADARVVWMLLRRLAIGLRTPYGMASRHSNVALDDGATVQVVKESYFQPGRALLEMTAWQTQLGQRQNAYEMSE
jgi:hypothetical protein